MEPSPAKRPRSAPSDDVKASQHLLHACKELTSLLRSENVCLLCVDVCLQFQVTAGEWRCLSLPDPS